MKMLTILATEDFNKEAILDLLDANLSGYTISSTCGVWQGIRENSLFIYIVDAEQETIDDIIERIKCMNDQESVMVLTIPCGVEFK